MKYAQISLFLLLLALNAIAQDAKTAGKLYSEKQYDKARANYVSLLTKEPQNPEYLTGAGFSYLFGSQKFKAEEYLKKALDINKKPSDELMFNYAWALHLNNKFDEAIVWYKKSDKMGTNRFRVAKGITECGFGKTYVANPVKASFVNMGKAINTAFNEYNPCITANQQNLYFTSRRSNTTGGKIQDDGLPYEDIYASQFKSGAWTGGKQLPAPINTRENDFCTGISPSGQIMFIEREENGGDIFISELQGETWGKPEPFPYNTGKLETSACLSHDESKLYFVSDRGGHKDIYYCIKNKQGKWNSPIKCPSAINSLYDEESPFPHPDGKWLYFSSKGHSSMGGYDIFRVGINTVGAFGLPENLGYPINTAADDMFFHLSPDGKTGYFSSEKEGGEGLQDIYTITMPAPPSPPDLTLVKGTVIDGKTKLPTSATITVVDNATKEEVTRLKSNEKTGDFTIALPSGKNYGITVEKEGRLFYSKNVTTSYKNGYYEEVIEELFLPEMKVGAIVVLRNLFFESNKYNLNKESFPELDRMVDLMRKYPTLKVEIAGHTDNKGDAKANLILSKNRANAVKEYLVSKGIDASRCKAEGYGPNKPAAPNTTEGGRQLNRRTEMSILEM